MIPYVNETMYIQLCRDEVSKIYRNWSSKLRNLKSYFNLVQLSVPTNPIILTL